MPKKTLLNAEELHFSKSDLPLMIHGDEGCGASLFSISVVADLYDQGSDLIFLCGYPMARDEFEAQTQSKDDSILVSDNFDVDLIKTKRVIFIPSEQPELLAEVVASLDDSDERIIFYKNFDLFDESVFSVLEDLSNIVMMGNIDIPSHKGKLLNKKWASQLYFSVPQTDVSVDIPALEKYKGYLKSENREGIVTLG
ncbi:MAG: hypothetical protein LC687_02905 [Actinobacteria bacterium]|nr:hypothetical protein [Actinomycetota bacterium]